MPKKLKPTWCKHYCSPTHNETCRAGVPFDQFDGKQFEQRPCFYQNVNLETAPCDQREWPTREELEETERLHAEAITRMAKCLNLISEIKRDHKGKDWSGVKTCPVCTGRIHIQHAGYNGHCAARCETENCVNFRE